METGILLRHPPLCLQRPGIMRIIIHYKFYPFDWFIICLLTANGKEWMKTRSGVGCLKNPWQRKWSSVKSRDIWARPIWLWLRRTLLVLKFARSLPGLWKILTHRRSQSTGRCFIPSNTSRISLIFAYSRHLIRFEAFSVWKFVKTVQTLWLAKLLPWKSNKYWCQRKQLRGSSLFIYQRKGKKFAPNWFSCNFASRSMFRLLARVRPYNKTRGSLDTLCMSIKRDNKKSSGRCCRGWN